MKPEEFAQSVPGFSEKSHAEKVKLFGWHLHVHQGMSHFQPADIKRSYEAAHIALPSQFGGYFQSLTAGKELLKNSSGYRLENRARGALDEKYGAREITVEITKLLVGLPDKIPDLAERTYLEEALICYKHNAFRAAVVMVWNLAYHHLCSYVLKNRLAHFNARWVVSFPAHHKNKAKAIASMDDFTEELKESQVIEICKDAGIITKDIYKILAEKLGRRNSAAHPSGVKIGQLQVDDFIDDLMKNVMLKLV